MTVSMSYIGIKSCGCLVAACLDDPQYKKDTAKFVSDCIKSGYAIERIASKDVALSWCKCAKPEDRSPQLALTQSETPARSIK